MPPGTLLFTGEKKIDVVKLYLTEFDTNSFERRELVSLDDLPQSGTGIRWLQIIGLHDIDLLNSVGVRFGIHPLALEDLTSPSHAPKIEDFGDYLVVLSKILRANKDSDQIIMEHISLTLLPNTLISFQESENGFFDPILRRLENPKARMRKQGADYFLYALIDLIIDHYFLATDIISDRFERLEQKVIEFPVQSNVEEIHSLKQEIAVIKKSTRPMRKIIEELMEGDTELITEQIDIFLHDLHDHIVHVLDALDTLREMAVGLMETYVSQASQRLNEVMKVLTIISTIFIPLGFLAGIYGMNFENMPELHYKYSYFIVLGLMALVVLAMLLYFKKKKWW